MLYDRIVVFSEQKLGGIEMHDMGTYLLTLFAGGGVAAAFVTYLFKIRDGRKSDQRIAQDFMNELIDIQDACATLLDRCKPVHDVLIDAAKFRALSEKQKQKLFARAHEIIRDFIDDKRLVSDAFYQNNRGLARQLKPTIQSAINSFYRYLMTLSDNLEAVRHFFDELEAGDEIDARIIAENFARTINTLWAIILGAEGPLELICGEFPNLKRARGKIQGRS